MVAQDEATYSKQKSDLLTRDLALAKEENKQMQAMIQASRDEVAAAKRVTVITQDEARRFKQASDSLTKDLALAKKEIERFQAIIESCESKLVLVGIQLNAAPIDQVPEANPREQDASQVDDTICCEVCSDKMWSPYM